MLEICSASMQIILKEKKNYTIYLLYFTCFAEL